MLSEQDKIILEICHRFLRDDEEDKKAMQGRDGWKVRMARIYDDQLYKEFAIADLTRYRRGELGLRWRTEEEVNSGKGQTICASTTCNKDDHKTLRSYEVPFEYSEAGEVKQELVKVMVCRKCAKKLFFIAQPEIFGGNHDNRSNSTNEAIAMKTGGDTSNCESPNCQDMKSVGDKITKRQRVGY